MNKGIAVIALILLIFSLLVPAIALSNQTEVNGLNDPGNTTMPDLLVEDITASSPLYQNETARINATIRNNGTNASQFNLSFLIDDALKEEKTIDALNENEIKIVSFDWILDEAGIYSLKVVADSNGEIIESNESNNELEIEVFVLSALMHITVVIKDSDENIHIQDLFLKENESIVNATATACEKLMNMTFNSSDGNVTRVDGLDDPKLFLYNRESREWIEICIGHELEDMDIIGWSDEDDLPKMLPDLTPENLTITSFGGTAYTNVTNEIKVKVRNKGLVNASNFTSLFKVNDRTMDEIKIESLNRMENKSVSFNWIPNTTENYSLTVELDPENNISELNETNNNITIDVVTVKEITTIRIPEDYQTIQEAIDNAPPGSTIYVMDGEYHENIEIHNRFNLTIVGESKDVVIKSKTTVVSIVNSSIIKLSNLTLISHGREWGYSVITLINSSNCKICENSIQCLRPRDCWGMRIIESKNNTIYRNAIETPESGVIYIADSSENNTIYHNDFFFKSDSTDDGINNYWNSTEEMNYTYKGKGFKGYVGNYWDKYKGEDKDKDGIGDSPYPIQGKANASDYHPLVYPRATDFNLITTRIIRPYIIYANRTNMIGAFIERRGTYPPPEDVCVNLTVNSTELASHVITLSKDEKKVVWLPWIPNGTGNYTLKIDVQAVNEGIEENNADNEFSASINVSPPLFNYTDNITSALDFLNAEQFLTGSISGFSNSAHAALAIIAAGEDPAAGRWIPPVEQSSSLIDYLRNEPKDSVGFLPPGTNPPGLIGAEEFARMILVISAVGEDPTNFGDVNYLTMLKSFYKGKQFDDPNSVEDDAFAILALVSCGESNDKIIANATEYIKTKQNKEDGGWSSFGASSDVRATSLVIQALIAAGEDKDSVSVEKALDYLKAAQDGDGGYSDVISTSYVIQAFITTGKNPSNYTDKNPFDYLLSLQQPDGSFNYTTNMSLFPPMTTTYPLPALCGEPYPVVIKTIREDYELPDTSVSSIITEEEVCVNTSYTVESNIKSNGGIFYVDLLSDGEFVERKRVYSVWHDSLTTLSFTWKTNTTGPHNLTIFADSMNNVSESDEENDLATIEVNVTLPDLYPAEIITPAEIYVNVTNIINCTIKGTTDGHFNVTLEEAEDEPLGKQRIEGIRDNATISFEWRPSKNKAYNLRLVLDYDEEVRERDENNNTLEETVNVLLPDMIPASITADEIFVNARNKVNVTVNGMAENFNLSLIENGTVVGKTTNVTCYEKENVSIEWKPTSLGNHTITAFVDSNDDIKETDETNNKINATFEVLLPDLVPEDIAPDVLYIDEVNTVNVKVNGTAERFNATLVADEIVDRSGPLCFLIAPIFNGTFGISETLSGTTTDFNLTYNITAQRTGWSWEDIDTLSVSITSNTSSGLVDRRDTWSVDYVAAVVNYTLNSTNRTLELNASDIVSHGNWSNGNNTNISDDEYATTTEITTLQLDITDTDAVGNITSVVIKVEQHVVDAVPTKKGTTLKKTNLNTYNGSIAFEWLPMKLGEYKLSVFMDSDNDTAETNETNNNLSKSVIVAKRIDLELTSPLGGETWEGIQNITWNASYEEPLLIDFYYSPDRGYRWINITTNETNNGSYAWNTEDVIDGEYMIKIVARAGLVTAEDRSDVFFVRNTKAGMEWGSFHANAGYAPCDAPDTNEIAWISDDIGAEGSSSLIVARGKIFVYCTGWEGSPYTYLVALKQSDDGYGEAGDVLWATKIAPQKDGSWATPAYKDGSIFVSSGHGVYRIDADDGDVIWEFRFPTGGGSVNGGPAVTRRAVYVGDWDGFHYYCIDKNNGTEIWSFPVPGRTQSVPAIAYGNAYFGSCGYDHTSAVYAVDAVDGTEFWRTDIDDRNLNPGGSVTLSDHVVYVTMFDIYGIGGRFYALDAFNGSVMWSEPISYTDSTPAFYTPSKSVRSYVYVTGEWAGPGKTHCFDAKTGELIWEVSGLGFWTNSPVVTKDGKVFVGKPGGTFGYAGLYCLDAFTGKEIWHSDYGGSSPVVVNGFVYTIGSGRVFVFGNGTRPDLTVKAYAPDKKCVAGTKENINATIKNNGTLNVTKRFKVELRYQGDLENPIDEETIDRLNVNETETITFDWPLPEWLTEEKTRNYTLTVEVDPSNNVSESGWGDNNFADVNVTVHDNKPDLTTSITSVSPGTIYVGDMVTVVANITNIGYETDEKFYVKFFDNGYNPPKVQLISLEGNKSEYPDYKWPAPNENGTYNLMVEVNPPNTNIWTIKNELNWTNNNASTEVKVMPTPTPTPTPETPGYGPDGHGGHGGGDEGGIGEGSGTGKAGAGEAGGMQIPVNASGSADETKKEVSGFPFGNATSGASGGGGTLPILLVLLAILVVALFYFGYYKEKRAYAKHIFLKALRSEGDKSGYRRNKK